MLRDGVRTSRGTLPGLGLSTYVSVLKVGAEQNASTDCARRRRRISAMDGGSIPPISTTAAVTLHSPRSPGSSGIGGFGLSGGGRPVLTRIRRGAHRVPPKCTRCTRVGSERFEDRIAVGAAAIRVAGGWARERGVAPARAARPPNACRAHRKRPATVPPGAASSTGGLCGARSSFMFGASAIPAQRRFCLERPPSARQGRRAQRRCLSACRCRVVRSMAVITARCGARRKVRRRPPPSSEGQGPSPVRAVRSCCGWTASARR